MKALVITVGTGKDRKDIAEAILFSIREYNPDYILFLVTPKTEKETLPLVLEGIAETKWETFISLDENNVERLFQEYMENISRVITSGFKPAEIVADFTSGTKPMSAALFAAGVAADCGLLSYIGGERDSGGRVIPDKMKISSLEPVITTLHNRRVLIAEFFNHYQFEAALKILDLIRTSPGPERVRQEAESLATLVLFFTNWDLFNLEKAIGLLSKIIASKDPYLRANEGLVEKLMSYQKLFNSISPQEKAQPEYSEFNILNLLANTARRIEEGKFDDAVARMYRTLENLAQYRLWKTEWQIKTGEFNPRRLPEGRIRDKWVKWAEGRLGMNDDEKGRVGKKKKKLTLGMALAYELLNDLRDPIGVEVYAQYTREESDLNLLLTLRNTSILAHGFIPVGENSSRALRDMVFHYVRKAVTDFDQKLENMRFPKLNYNKMFLLKGGEGMNHG
jgi:CRISPR-associated protein (TIGR02710 family)